MNILIIGGAGYVGSHKTQLMCNNGYNVFVLDNLSTGHEDAIDSRATFINGDIRDFDLVCKILKENKIEAIIHFAALSLVGESVNKPLEYYDNNTYGMQVLLKAMVETGVDKIIFSSTAATYGDHKVMPITEDYLTNPTNPYGETKLAMEKMIKWTSEAHGIKYVSLRYFNVAGASLDSSLGERHNPETHLIPIVLEEVLGKREFLSIFGDDYDTPDGTCIRDYIHVLDLVSAHELALKYLVDGKESDIFNLGYGHGFSVKEIVDATEKVVNKKINTKIVPRRAGDPASLVASNDKVKKTLGWEPKYDDINVIISSAYDFFKKEK